MQEKTQKHVGEKMPRGKKRGTLGTTSQARRGPRHHNTGKRMSGRTSKFNLPADLEKKVKK